LVVGYRQKKGKGTLTVLGLAPPPELVAGLHDYVGISIPARPTAPGIQTMLYRRQDHHYLFVINNGSETKGVEILLDAGEFPKDAYIAKDLLDGGEKSVVIDPHGQRSLFVNVSQKSGTLFAIKSK